MKKKDITEVTDTSRRRFLQTAALCGVGMTGLGLAFRHNENANSSQAFSAHVTVNLKPRNMSQQQHGRLALNSGKHPSQHSGRREV